MDRYETMITFTVLAAKYNGFRPQEDLAFALNTGYIIVLYPLIIKRVAQSAFWWAQLIITVIHLLCEYRAQCHTWEKTNLLNNIDFIDVVKNDNGIVDVYLCTP